MYLMEKMLFLVLVWHYEVLMVQRLKLGLSGERGDSADVLDGLCSNL